MSNSPYVSYKKISPHRNSPRNHAIDRISIHCVVGQVTMQSLGEIFQTKAASSNYGVDRDGHVGMYVEEKDRSWCSDSPENDHRAVTIETASDVSEPYAVNAAAYATLLNLCTDICKRNGKKKLLWMGSKEKTLAYTPKADEMVLTVHRWFNPYKSCPGTYLYERQGAIAAEVTKRLTESEEKEEPDLTEAEAKKIARKEIEAYFAELAKKPVADWAKEAVDFVKEQGLMNGDAEGGFRPQSFITRQEMAAVLKNEHDK